MRYFIGIDIGSEFSKGVITGEGEILTQIVIPSGINYKTAALKLRDELLKSAGISEEDIACTATTGHGEKLIPFSSRHISTALCCAKGIRHVFPEVRTVLDIQGQSSQVIKLSEKGRISDHSVNDICASGSGYFLTVVSNILQIDINDVGPLSLKSSNPVTFTTGCAVFGESEAISRVAEGTPKEDILAGVNNALASRLASLVNDVGMEMPCAVCGGGGLNAGLIKSLAGLGIEADVPPNPQLINAIGAACFAEEYSITADNK
ncbi:MAG: 2-hydroxyglutaryl-CoA dehydratase [Spirochaetes bacterium]|nr:2-hydroxyglutaryl-CoA dehydratase [Spirochaetota bacterium]